MAVELIAASPVGTPSTGGSTTLTVTMSENGVASLGRTQFFCADNLDLIGYSNRDLTECCEVTSILINGSTELLRGRNNPSAPSGVFSPMRNHRFLDLGDWAFSTGDTVAFTVTMGGTNLASEATMAFPFMPRNIREGYIGPMPQSKMSYAGSPTSANIAASGAVDLTITFDQDGVVNLDDLVVYSINNQAATGEYGPEALSSLLVTQITLPSNQQIVVGQAPGGVAGASFRATRNGNWFSLGRLFVSAGSQLVVGVDNASVDIADASCGIPFWPADGKGGLC